MNTIFSVLSEGWFNLLETVFQIEFMGFSVFEFAFMGFMIHSFARFVLFPSLGGRLGKVDIVKEPKRNEVGFVLHDKSDKRLR